MWVWYRGGGFHGFQALKGERTVQGVLQEALLTLGLEGAFMPAGRTDRGVHARMQVVSLRLPTEVEPAELAAKLNPVLPGDVGIAGARWAPKSFHAQWSASAKEYRYRLVLGEEVPEPWRDFVWHVPADPAFADGSRGAAAQLERLTPGSLRERLDALPGRRTFVAFHARSSVVKERAITQCELRAVAGAPGVLEIILRGSGFGRFMVRYLVGGAIAAASGWIDGETWRRALEEEVSFPGLRAPARGLVLWEVLYPEDRTPFADFSPALSEGPPF